MKENVKRFDPEINIGLINEQINRRKEENLQNFDTTVPTKSFKQILIDNFFTIFNLINLILGIAIFSVRSYKNMLFLIVVILNSCISTFQEIRSKITIDKLSLMVESKVKVIRNSKKEEISISEIVLDDLIELNSGNQIVTDSIIKKGNILVNESFITGEPNAISKSEGDMLLSGSFVVSGKCIAKVEHIGDDNYTAKISKDAKYIKKSNSEIMNSLNRIIKFISIIIIPLGLLMLYTQFAIEGTSYESAIVQTVAAIIGMIPEGLVLLTSSVLALSSIRLSKNKVLVQDLYCIETLARVDTIAFDKTGTLTDGTMEVKNYISFDNTKKDDMYNILANISNSSEDDNSTINAIKEYFNIINNKFTPDVKVSFSSQSKWSGIHFENIGSYIIGAPEFILKDDYNNCIYKSQIENYSKEYRVLALCYSENNFIDNNLPNNINIIGVILIKDKLRKEAKSTIKYFYKQDVDIKIISGDNPITISKIAKDCGIKNYDSYYDMSKYDEKEDSLEEIVSSNTIFGRVSPTQKKDLIIALKNLGKTVAMTGDGVNDVLALKESDCSIALADGSDASKNVSELVILNSSFSSLPKVVLEGRKSINNIQRSASLFLVKTVYSTLLTLLFLLARTKYPFIPIQLSLISLITIGIPSFMLALEPNKERIKKGNFLKNIISKAIPTGLCVVINIILIVTLLKFKAIPKDYFSSLCVISTGICGLLLLFTLSLKQKNEKTRFPFSIYRFSLFIIMTLIFIICLHYLGWFYNIVPLYKIINQIISLLIISIFNYIILNLIFIKILKIK